MPNIVNFLIARLIIYVFNYSREIIGNKLIPRPLPICLQRNQTQLFVRNSKMNHKPLIMMQGSKRAKNQSKWNRVARREEHVSKAVFRSTAVGDPHIVATISQDIAQRFVRRAQKPCDSVLPKYIMHLILSFQRLKEWMAMLLILWI